MRRLQTIISEFWKAPSEAMPHGWRMYLDYAAQSMTETSESVLAAFASGMPVEEMEQTIGRIINRGIIMTGVWARLAMVRMPENMGPVELAELLQVASEIAKQVQE